MTKSIYLDYSASAEPNPSSVHEKGIKARNALLNARKHTAVLLGARAEEIIFTSGATESNNLAIQGIVWAMRESGMLPHIVTTNIEHPSVLETVKMLEKRNLAKVSIVRVEENGIVDVKKIKKEINKNTVLVSVMYANNEIGTIQPIKEIAKAIRHYRKENGTTLPYFHTDAVQAVNYLDLNVEKLGVDMLSLSGSKISGAGRIGVLYKRKSVPLVSIMAGGSQEQGLRPGTENLPAILKFFIAFKKVQVNKEKEAQRLKKLRDYFIDKLKNVVIKDVVINGDLESRLPNNVNITVPNIPSDLLVIELSARGIMASEKSACKSGEEKTSHVIEAIRPVCKKGISGSLRFSFGQDTTKADLDYTLKSLFHILTKLKKWYC